MTLEKGRAMRYLVVAGVVLAAVFGQGWGQEKTPAEAPDPKVTLEVKNSPLGEALIKVAKSTKLSLVLDPLAQVDGKAADGARVTLKSNQLTALEFVQSLVQPLWLETDLADGVVFISNNVGWEDIRGINGKPGPKEVMDPDVRTDVLAKLREAKVTREGPAPLRKVTEDVVREAGFKLRYDLRYRKPGEGPTTVFAVYDLPLASWLNWVSRLDGFGWTVEGETIVITDRAVGRDFRLEKKLKNTLVSFDFKDTPAMEVARFLEPQVLASIVIFSPKRVTLKMDRVTAEAAIAGLGTQLGLSPTILNGSVLLCDPQELKFYLKQRKPSASGTWLLLGRATPADLELREKVRKETVSFTFKDLPLKEALNQLAQMGKVNIVLASNPQSSRGFVTIKLDTVSLETALRLLGGQTGLKCSIIGGKVLVSDEDGIRKASKGGVR